jgi:sialate O-acetylesterase
MTANTSLATTQLSLFTTLTASLGVVLMFYAMSAAHAKVVPGVIFQDHAVLQAGKPLPVWGSADVGEKITVSFAGQSASATADASGKWRVLLKQLTPNAAPTTLTIAGNDTIVINDVLVGDVWMCSGQSNMEFRVRQANNAEQEIANASHPNIRLLRVRKSVANTPQASLIGSWAISSPETAGEFSAIAYYFAREIQQKAGIPVGILSNAWGGTDIEAWMSQESIAPFAFVQENWQKRLDDYPTLRAKYDAFQVEEERKFQAAKARGERYEKAYMTPIANPDGSPHQAKASNIFNAMVSPFTPAAIAGVLWYQGENNTGRVAQYRELFPALIKGWRSAFAQADLPFYWVQLPNFRGNEQTQNWTWMRDAQSVPLTLPHTAQAIAIDIGEVEEIHPKNKQEVAYRLALIALKNHYGKNLIASGPTVTKISFSKDSVTVKFNDLAGGLKFKGDALTGFEIAGEDKVFKPAEASISGDTVTVKSAEVQAPVAVRYAWRNAPLAALYNKADLPAAPFRSDNW